MESWVKLHDRLYVNLDTGVCGHTASSNRQEKRVRLTRGQRKVFHALVMKEGRLCTLDSLEMLFDDSNEGYPSIKNYIHGIKATLKKADPSLRKKELDEMFQSVYDTGYIFHLPPEGELIKKKVPLDALFLLRSKEIIKMKISDPEDLARVKRGFFGITEQKKIILQAVSSGLYSTECEPVAQALTEYIFDKRFTSRIIFVTGDIGVGKTTLLYYSAVQTAVKSPSWNVYTLDVKGISENDVDKILESLYENSVSRIRKTLLCVDHPDKNRGIFRLLCKKVIERRDPNLYVAAAERTSQMFEILESQAMTAEENDIRCFFLDYQSRIERERKFRIASVQFEDIRYMPLTVMIKRSITDQMIDHYIVQNALSPDTVQKARKGLFYSDRTITDIYNEFINFYNINIREKGEGRETSWLPVISQEWNEWKERCSSMDDACIKLKLSEAFPYLAACSIFRITITYELIYEMTGYPYKEKFAGMFPPGLGESIQFKEDCLQFRNSTVTESYFLYHPEITLQSCLETLIMKRYMDEETVVWFEKSVFRFQNCRFPQDFSYVVDFRKLYDLFVWQKPYIEIVTRHGRAHSPELSRLAFQYGEILNLTEKKKLEREFSASFSQTCPKALNPSVERYYWLKYFEASMMQCPDVPESLIDYAAADSEKMILMLYITGDHYRQKKKNMSLQWRGHYAEHTVRLCRHMMGEYPEEPMPFVIAADMLTEVGNYSEAMSLYSSAIEITDTEEQQLSLKLSYLRCYSARLDQMAAAHQIDIAGIQRQLSEIQVLYDDCFRVASRTGVPYYIETMLSFCSFLMLHGGFEESYENLKAVAEAVLQEEEHVVKIYEMLGDLCRIYPGRNPCYDLSNAVFWYEKGYEIMQKKIAQTKREQIFFLHYKLAETYNELGIYGKAKTFCEEAVKMGLHNEKAIALLRRIDENSCDPY